MNAKGLTGEDNYTVGSDHGDRRTRAIRLLLDRRANTIEHLNGFLLDHLERTEGLLTSWGCSEEVSTAGLCHAFYGTDGFDTALLGLEHRDLLVTAVGKSVEELVYLYASCDRRFLYPQLGSDGTNCFRDRCTGDTFPLSGEQLRDFVDLTLANESDVGIVGRSSEGIPAWLTVMYRQFRHLASPSVSEGCQRLVASGKQPNAGFRISLIDDNDQ